MPASIGVNLRVTGHCAQGGRRYMEDLFSVAYQQTEDERDLEYAFFGIYDGHGGGEAAAYAKEHLMDSIVKQRAFWSARDEDVLRAIRNGYMLTHLNMWKELDKWPKTVTGLPSTAGTTASVAFIRRGKIYIGHVGDSAIVLGYQKEGSDQWVAKPLTLDHKPESTAEMERIQQSGGKVVSKAGVPRVVWNRPRAGHKGPIKKTTPVDEIPFLAVARSLGDLWSYNVHNDEFIVSPDPDVGVLNIDTDKFRCLIFGTDGLWNMISAETAVNLVQATERHNEAAVVAGGQDWLNPSKSLVDNALERWSNTRMRADNTSVVTLMLDPPGPPRAAVLRSRNTPQRPLAANTQAAPSVIPQDKCEETTKPEVPSTEDAHPVPQKGLKIMTRYTEEQPPATPELSPLPPCATLDSRFSVAPTDEICNGHEEEIDEAATTYGNPSDSYFISRLLNRTHVTNTLLNFFEDNIAKDEEKAREQTPPPQSTVPDAEGPTAVTNEDAPVEGLSVDSSFESEEEPEASTEDEQAVEPPDDVESIQINEVSSSSPTDSPPKPRGRKTRAESQLRQPATNGRTLRSHDAGTPQRPQTRLTSNRGRSNQGQSTSLERVVILSRARGVPISPAVVQVERMPQLATESRPLTRKHNEPKTVAPPPDSRVKVMRSTRSRDVNPMNLTQKLVRNQSNPGHKEIRSVVTRGSENVVQLNRAGNAVRAPGSSRRNAPAAVRDRSETPDARPEHSKENFTMKRYKVCVLRSRHVHAAPLPPSERRRTRLCDKRDPLGALDVSAIAQPSLPLGAVTRRSPVRRMRRCRTEEVCAEVHSTTGENEPQRMECSPSASTALTVKPRALRSRNDESTSATVVRRDVATKRPPRAIDDEHSPPGKTPKMMEKPLCAEKCTRVASKRSSGSWAPALALRNRLRKRLAK